MSNKPVKCKITNNHGIKIHLENVSLVLHLAPNQMLCGNTVCMYACLLLITDINNIYIYINFISKT